jgi:competence protein ComFB
MSIEIENYYEHLLLEEMNQLILSGDLKQDQDVLSDIACLAMNNLPARYTHNPVDMAFFLSANERYDMTNKVAVALNNAIDKVAS